MYLVYFSLKTLENLHSQMQRDVLYENYENDKKIIKMINSIC